ncbi:MAG: EscU/YscU/HrcU family type III secretion system export apparatus switch protein [Planctomycetaceae bacterium]|jgi:flagellar biosynthetic protein FlhB|nr:EscU/YscU/HrcU family type III secretion system export apparatus switch protein [Planctomycetaceae bacterium]
MPEGDKTHDATPHRREQAREKGQVARSQDLASALVLVVAIILLMVTGRSVIELFMSYTRFCVGEHPFLGSLSTSTELFHAVTSHCREWTQLFLIRMSFFFLVLVLIAISANLAQVGFLWLPSKLAIDITHLDPIKGFGRIFSTQSLVRLGMGIVKLIIAGAVAWYAGRNDVGTIINSLDMDEWQISEYMIWFILWLAFKVAIALALIAVIDFMYQKWKHEQDLKMTTQEIRDEMKNMMGDPQILSKRRQIQRQMAQQRTAQGVQQSDVVVSNPTELAVALRYDPDTMRAPIVMAKGADEMAKMIRRIALQNNVPIVERKPLAQALFKYVEVGDEIPEAYWEPVVEILKYVYELRNKKIPIR